MSMLFLSLRKIVFANNFARSVKNKTRSVLLIERSVHASGVNGSDSSDYESQQISTQQLMKHYEQKVDEDRLTHDELAIHRAHMKAIQENQHMYKDPVTGFEVFTILAHLERGYCCGNACRHCAYSYKNVDVKYKTLKKHNTAFYN